MDLLRTLVQNDGSDLHLVAGSRPMFRTHGDLKPLEGEETIFGRTDVLKLFDPYLTEAQKAAIENRQDINTSIVSDDTVVSQRYGRAGRFRVCVFWDSNGAGASLRVIPLKIPTLPMLFTSEIESTFHGLVNLRRGLTLVVGPVGSGKSTTVASMIDTINTERSERIFTIEDPIEYLHTSKKSLISQREVGIDIESYEQGGLSVMRADPDVILVGELRTPESVRIALALAETGHLVFATMHANSVSEAVRRLVESFPDNKETMQSMIARCLNAVIGQSLLPRADGSGRVPANEIMIVNARIRRMIAGGETDISLAIEAGLGEGMCSMDDSIISHYNRGTITYDAAWHRIQDPFRLGPRPTTTNESVAC